MRDNTLDIWASSVIDLMSREKEKLHTLDHNFKHEFIHFGYLGEIDLEKIYPGAEGKMTSLKKAYFNQESLDRAKMRLAEGANSVSISLQAKDKTYTKQDHCMVSMVIYRDKKDYEVTVFYRVTEICRKFLFDLKFIREVIMPYLGIENYYVTFFFTRITLSLIFLHTLFLLYPNFLESLKDMDKKGYEIGEDIKKLLGDYLQYLDKMINRKEKGSMLRSHWRHFQKFKNTKEFKDLYEYLRRKNYARSDQLFNEDLPES